MLAWYVRNHDGTLTPRLTRGRRRHAAAKSALISQRSMPRSVPWVTGQPSPIFTPQTIPKRPSKPIVLEETWWRWRENVVEVARAFCPENDPSHKWNHIIIIYMSERTLCEIQHKVGGPLPIETFGIKSPSIRCKIQMQNRPPTSNPARNNRETCG